MVSQELTGWRLSVGARGEIRALDAVPRRIPVGGMIFRGPTRVRLQRRLLGGRRSPKENRPHGNRPQR